MQNKNGEILNPCLKEQELTYKCFNNNNFDKQACELEIQNYKTCKDFWYSVRTERRRKGIQPNLPLPEEREKIKREYLSQLKH